jgi:hypothetical protein
MKAKAIILAGGLILATITGFAGNDKKESTIKVKKETAKTLIKGKVVDNSTGEALPGVEVYVEDVNKQVYTDFNGNFVIENLEPGEYDLNASYISYKEMEQDVKIHSSANPTELQLKLEKVE